MQYGRTDDSPDNIDFTLAPDSELTSNTLKTKLGQGELSIFIGAPKWGEKSWRGIIYPKKYPDNQLLTLYSQCFNTVEFGPTFYNIYKPEDLNRWTAQVAGSPGFKFCPKFPRIITHLRKLTNAQEETLRFYQSLTAFGDHLGPLLLQLGENFSPNSFPQLKAYLESLPPAIKVSVEVRHKDWFVNPNYRKELFHLLRDLNIGTIISDTAGRRDGVHMELTTSDAIVRFVGNNLADSDYRRMDDWAERLRDWAGQGLQSIWFFMHQNDEKFVPEACVYLIDQLNAKLKPLTEPPKLIC